MDYFFFLSERSLFIVLAQSSENLQCKSPPFFTNWLNPLDFACLQTKNFWIWFTSAPEVNVRVYPIFLGAKSKMWNTLPCRAEVTLLIVVLFSFWIKKKQYRWRMTQLKVGLVCFPFIGLRIALYRASNLCPYECEPPDLPNVLSEAENEKRCFF